MKISPQALRTLVFHELSPPDKKNAVGTFAGPDLPDSYPSNDPNDPIAIWFEEGTQAPTRKAIMQDANTKAILFLSADGFKILSAPTLQFDRATRTFLILGHMGDRLSYFVPVKIDPDIAMADFYGLLPIDTPDGDNHLSHLKTTGPNASDAIIHDANGDPFPNGALTFFKYTAPDQRPADIDLNGLCVARLPMAVPLPKGHGLSPASLSDEIGLQNMQTRIQALHPFLQEWFNAALYSATHLQSMSLGNAALAVPEEYFAGINHPNTIQDTLAISLIPLDPDSPRFFLVSEKLEAQRALNIDRWIEANKDSYNEITSRIAISPEPRVSEPAIAPRPAQQSMSKLERDEDARATKVIATYRILIARKATDENGDPTLVPGELRPLIEEFIQSANPRKALGDFQLAIRNYSRLRQRDIDSVINNETDIAHAVFDTAFVSKFTNATLCEANLHDPECDIESQISIWLFNRFLVNSNAYKTRVAEMNEIRDQYLMSGNTVNSKPVPTDLFIMGEQQSIQDVFRGYANVHAFLCFLEADDGTLQSHSYLALAIHQLFRKIKSSSFLVWFAQCKDRHGHNCFWMAHVILADLHNLFATAVRIARNPDAVAAVTQGHPLPITVFEEMDAFVSVTLAKWETAIRSASPGIFHCKPATFPDRLLQKPKDTKDPNKRQKTNDHQANSSYGSVPTDSRAPRASDPTKGFFTLAPGAAIGAGPRGVSKQPCFNFTIVGKSCNKGNNCQFAHYTHVGAIPTTDVAIFNAWVQQTPSISWTRGEPTIPTDQSGTRDSPTPTQSNTSQQQQAQQSTQQQQQQTQQQPRRGGNGTNTSASGATGTPRG